MANMGILPNILASSSAQLPQSGATNLGFGSQSEYDPNGYAQLYSNWVNQKLAPMMQQYGQQQPAQSLALTPQQRLQQFQQMPSGDLLALLLNGRLPNQM